MKQPSPTPQVLGRIPSLAPMIGAQRHDEPGISVAPLAENQKSLEGSHATEPSPTEIFQRQLDRRSEEEPVFEHDQEARRIAAELVKLHRDGAISGPDDSEARFWANLIHTFGATYNGKGGA
jgi:hypothetical protein